MPSFRLNLTSTRSVSDWLPVPSGATKASFTIIDSSTTTWGAAVVDLQYSLLIDRDELDAKRESAQAFSPAVQFSSTAKSKRNIGVSAAGHVRLKVSTLATAADPNALVTYVFS